MSLTRTTGRDRQDETGPAGEEETAALADSPGCHPVAGCGAWGEGWAAIANEYVSAAALKATLGITVNTFDADIDAARVAASRGIDGICDRRFYPDADANQVRYYTPWGYRALRIDDLATHTEVGTNRSGDGTSFTALTLNTDYFLEPLNAAADGQPFTRITWHPFGYAALRLGFPRYVRVTGKFGWATVPDSVVEATSILAAALYKRAREAPFGIQTVGVDQGTAARIARSDPHVMMLLGPFMRLNA
jgi:hypothetical protein